MSPASYQTAPPRAVVSAALAAKINESELQLCFRDCSTPRRWFVGAFTIEVVLRSSTDPSSGCLIHHRSREMQVVVASVVQNNESELQLRFRERETGLEPATPTLARLCSTN